MSPHYTKTRKFQKAQMKDGEWPGNITLLIDLIIVPPQKKSSICSDGVGGLYTSSNGTCAASQKE